MTYDLIVIGGGAAGFFGAIQASEMKPQFKILIIEKSTKLLSKVKISGGGRCNVTHHCFEATKLSRHYPRGEKVLRDIFKMYQAKETVNWFNTKGVLLKTEDDGRMFPETDDSQTIIDCLMQEAHQNNIKIEMGDGVVKIIPEQLGFQIMTQKGRTLRAENILVASGGNPGAQAYDWIAELGHTIIRPIPSLFTFNDSEKNFKDLMGVAVPVAEVKISGTKFIEYGPVLITHWGLSGPAVIKLSSWAAEYLHQENYTFTALVNWLGTIKEDELRALLLNHKETNGKQKVYNQTLFSLPQRLWVRLCELSEIEGHKIWAETANKNINRLIEFLIRCPFRIKGKTTFKEEFVTCGGVDLKEVDLRTMESKRVKKLFFAGEVLNIDGETGGFNFQAAWSTAFVAARGITTSPPAPSP